MDWLSLALMLLKLASAFVDWGKARQQFNAGADAEIARESKAILAKTVQGKKIVEAIDALSDDGLDKLLDDLAQPPAVSVSHGR